MYDNLEFTALETRGFLVIHKFLTQTEVNSLNWGYLQIKENIPSSGNQKHNYADFAKLFGVPNKLTAIIAPKIKTVCEKIVANTNIKLNFDVNQLSGFYADLNFINGNDGNDSTLVWHQDQGAWTYHQQSYDYINFYVMVDKVDPTITNLSVIPQDILKLKVPNQIEKILRHGAQRFFPNKDYTLVKNDDSGEEFSIPININNIAEHPNLLPGDVLLVRGDIIHKSQDNIAPRTAASFRVFDNSIINKQKLLSGGKEKQDYLANNRERIIPILSAFEYFGRDDITYTEYFNHANKLL